MLVQYYENRIIVVGQLWSDSEGSYIYSLKEADARFLYDLFEETELITRWVKEYAVDFQTVTDYQLEVFEKTKSFKDEDSWLLVD